MKNKNLEPYIVSILGVISSLIVIFYIASTGVVISENELENDEVIKRFEEKNYDVDQLNDAHERFLSEIVEDANSKESIAKFNSAVKHQSSLYIWIPWLVISLLFRINTIKKAVIAIVVPSILVVAGIFDVMQFISMCSGMFLAILALKIITKSRA